VFHGVLPHDRLMDVLRSTDIYVHPSFTEGQPRAVIEAMSVGVPVVGAAAGGTPENLPEHQVFRPGDDQELARIIESMIRNGLGSAVEWSCNRAQHFSPDRLTALRDGFLGSLAGLVSSASSDE